MDIIDNKPVISVVIITYLHENYIKDTLNGVFNQKTNFPIEIIISNDCSPDQSNIVIQEIIENSEFKNNIKYYNQPKNLGLMDNFVFALKQAKGKYIAFCEGDDYWTDEYKLQKQYDFLEKNKNIVFCFHNTSVLIESSKEIKKFIGLENYVDKQIIPLEKLFLRVGGSFPFPTAVFKRDLIDDLPPYFYSFGVGDAPLMLHSITNGDIAYLDENMCVCRVTSTNWTSHNNIFKNMYANYTKKYKAYLEFNNYTNNKYSKYLKITLNHLTYQVVYAFFQEEKSKSKRFLFFMKHISDLSLKNISKSIYRIFIN